MKRNYFRRFLGIHRAIIFVLFAQLFTLTTTAEEVVVDGIKYDAVKKAKQATVIANSYSGDVVIPSSFVYEGVEYSVTSIGSDAFYNCRNLTSVTIPNSVSSICNRAFANCTGLTFISIPNSVESIGAWAFSYCLGLTSVTIGNSVENIGSYAFSNCSGLTSITIPNSVTIIDSHAFYACSGLKSVTIPNSVTRIAGYAFNSCSGLTSVTIGNSVTSIGMYAFDGCSGLTKVEYASIESMCKIKYDECAYSYPSYYAKHLYINGQEVTDLVIPESVTSIGDGAFKYCSSLTSVTIPNSVTSIGDYAFNECTGLTSVTIPNSVTSIGRGAFYDCTGLTSVTIPNSVTSIGDHAFRDCSGLTSITIPNSVTSIGRGAFYDCTGLTSVTIPNSVTSIGDYAFRDCSGLTSITIPNSVTSIGGDAFYGCSGLKSVTIGNSVTSIGNSAFKNCEELLDVYCLARNVPKTETSAFDGSYPEYIKLHVMADAIEDYRATAPWSNFGTIIAISGDDPSPKIQFADAAVKAICVANWDTDGDGELSKEEAAKVKNIGTVFQSNKEITSFNEFQYFTGLTSIGTSTFYKCSGLTSVIIPMNVTNIGTQAFYSCSSLTSVTIPESVTSIGNSTFRDCSGLTSVTIPNSVTSIGESAFYYCSSLTKAEFESVESLCNIEFGNSVANPLFYAKHLFVNGQEIKDLTIPESVTSIGNYAFYDCSSLTSITIPNSVKSIGKDAFSFCIGLTSVTIPNSVTSIGNWAFRACSSLTSVTIPNSVTSIGERAFSGCSGLTSVTCHAMNVPTTGSSCFSGVPQSTATLYVPASSVNAYKSAEQWKNFSTILPIGSEVPTNYNITATANPANGGSIRGAGTYQDRASVTLTASPAEGYEFENWTENGTTVSTQATYTFAASQDRTLVANFQKTDEGNSEIYYSFNTSNNTATVVSGENKYTGNVVIPESVTYQGTTYPVTSIGNSAFEECTDLTSITFGNNVRSIGYASFDGCRNLKSVTFGSNMTIIGSWAFYRCSGLTSVTIPNSVTSVGEGAFSYCSGMKSATIGNGVTSIGNSAFSYCSDLTSVAIGNSVRSIGNSAFVGCSSLTSVNIPNSVTSIAAGTFWGCTSLKSITIPNSVESIGSDAFSGCDGLASVTLNSNNIVSAAYSSSNNLKTIFGSQVTRYILGNDVTGIGEYAFHGCSDLTSVTIPGSVTSIGAGAFDECTCLTSVTLNANDIVAKTYTSDSNLKTIFGSQVKEYILGDNVTGIGNYAFSGCSGLTSVTIGSGMTSIGTSSFYGCSGLKYVVCKAQNVPSTGSDCFGGITLSSATLYVPAASVNAYKSTSPWSGFGAVTSIPDNFNIWEIKLNRTEILLYEQGDTYRLTASVVPGYAANKTLRWTSSNTSVATVDANGLVTPVSQGTAVITATTLDGSNLSATCVVTVDADNVISDFSQLSNDKCYYFYTKDKLRGGLGVNKNYGSIASTFSVTNAKYKADSVSPFVVFNYNDNFYLYSVEANAFVTYSGGLTRTNITGSNAVDIIQNENGYFMISFAATGRVLNINTNPGLAINYWGTSDSEHDEGNQFTIEVAGDCDEYAIADLINESNTYSDEDIAHYSQTPVQSLSELSNAQVYTAVTYRAAWYVPASGTRLESTRMPIADKYSCRNTGQQFAFIQHNGQYYIYSVGEKKILNGRTDNNPNHGVLVTENCQPVSISETGDTQYPLFFNYGAAFNVNIDGSGNVAIDSWSTLDAGNMVALRPVQGVTLSDSEINRIIRYIDGSIPGDVNGDGEVNGADIVAVINYVLNDSKTDGDVNDDGEVNGADIVAVINYVLSYTSDAVRQQTYYAHRAPARPTDTSDRLYANTVTDGITVGLTNETDFTAFQFMLQLPEDCTLENVIADGLRLDNHVLQFRRMADGRYFVLGYNLDNENIAGHDGALLRLQLAGNICEGASVTDVMFFTPEAETRHLAGIQIDLVTGLTSLENATEDVTGNIYDMQGRVVMTSGQYAKQKNFLPTGIYIRNGRKFVVK